CAGNEETDAVAGSDAGGDIGGGGIGEADAGGVLLDVAAPHDDVARLAHGDAGAGGRIGRRILEQQVVHALGADAVGACGRGRVIPGDAHAAYADIAATADHQAVAARVLDRQVLDAHVVAGHDQAGRTGRGI